MTPTLDPILREDTGFVDSVDSHHALLDAMTEAVVVVDCDQIVRMANRRARELFGAEDEGLVGLPLNDPRYPARDEDGTPLDVDDYPIAITLRTGKPSAHVPMSTLLPDGSRLWISVSSTPLFRDGEDEPYGVVASITDITRYKEAEQQLARSNTDLSQFSSVVAHDLSAPLTVIAGMADLTLRRSGDQVDDKSRLMLERIGAAARGGQTLIRELLEYARSGTGELRAQDVELAPLTDGVLELLEPLATERQAGVSVGPLPTVRGDEVQLRQVFQNLLSNALKYGRPRSGRVRVEAHHEGSRWRISVTDDGVGIDPADFGTIFEMLSRTRSAEGYPGTGIGLALCKRIIERHGGRIWVDSTPGLGSTFSFTLPAT